MVDAENEGTEGDEADEGERDGVGGCRGGHVGLH